MDLQAEVDGYCKFWDKDLQHSGSCIKWGLESTKIIDNKRLYVLNIKHIGRLDPSKAGLRRKELPYIKVIITKRKSFTDTNDLYLSAEICVPIIRKDS